MGKLNDIAFLVGVRVQKLHFFQPLSGNCAKVVTLAEGSDGNQT